MEKSARIFKKRGRRADCPSCGNSLCYCQASLNNNWKKNKEEKIYSLMEHIQDITASENEHLIIYCDGAGWDGKNSAYCVVAENYKYVEVFHDEWTNNEMEYIAMFHALLIANKNNSTIYCDSQLIVNQLQGLYNLKSESLRPIFIATKSLLLRTRLIWISRWGNKAGIYLDSYMKNLRGHSWKI